MRNQNRKPMPIRKQGAKRCISLTAYPVVVAGTLDSAASLENNINTNHYLKWKINSEYATMCYLNKWSGSRAYTWTNLGSSSLQASSCNMWRNQQHFFSLLGTKGDFLFLNIPSQELVTSELLKLTLQADHYMGGLSTRDITTTFQTHSRQKLEHL